MVRLCSSCGGGGTGDRPRSCTLMEGGPCRACEESAAIYHQIKQLEKEIDKLKEKRRALATTMNANHDPFIHKFPPEIGSHIFHLCLPSLDSQISDLWWRQMAEWNVPLRLGAVCRKWRQLAWATSKVADIHNQSTPQKCHRFVTFHIKKGNYRSENPWSKYCKTTGSISQNLLPTSCYYIS